MDNLFESFYHEMDKEVSALENACIKLKEDRGTLDQVFIHVHNIGQMTDAMKLHGFAQINKKLEKLLFFVKDNEIDVNEKVSSFLFEICLYMKFHLVTSEPSTDEVSDPENLLQRIDLFCQDSHAA